MRVYSIASLALLAACSTVPSLHQRLSQAESLAARRDWHRVVLPGSDFDLMAFLPARTERTAELTVYLEGDGLAWLSPNLPSPDPTPVVPVALTLALAQPSAGVAYLARPCQYVGAIGPKCQMTYWTDGRFAPSVVASVDAAISTLMERFGASRLTLVGYSGGGAVAALVAARRSDVSQLITVAGNLDTHAWTRAHGVPALTRSLNPANLSAELSRIPQVHLVGTNDRTVPPSVAQSYRQRFAPTQAPTIVEFNGYTHACCWLENWPEIWRTATRQVSPLPNGPQ